MQRLNRIKFLLSLVSLKLALSGCSVQPPDVYVFEYLQQHLSNAPVTGHLILQPSPACVKAIGEVECGHGVAIVSGKEIYVGEAKTTWFGGKPWSQIKAESIYIPSEESYAPLATYIINSCKKLNCNDQVTRFKVKVDAVVNSPLGLVAE